MLKSDIKLALPKALQEEMVLHELLVQPDAGDIGILVMIHDLSADATGYVVRVYLLGKVDGEFKVHDELEAFAFPDHEAAVSFANRLRSMTALELLIIMNGHGNEGFSIMLQ
ncbi:hypothetical protein [Sporosarcina beigongshangi]|uniref:hypothetical protein n=1 Tax=Sporosarcina beigongshangi TaxID=2782538 RepID=UPI0019395D0D|nr:hypothetical protein [Sporosarcina beigongshangi]